MTTNDLVPISFDKTNPLENLAAAITETIELVPHAGGIYDEVLRLLNDQVKPLYEATRYYSNQRHWRYQNTFIGEYKGHAKNKAVEALKQFNNNRPCITWKELCQKYDYS